jgi:hypothetical protein
MSELTSGVMMSELSQHKVLTYVEYRAVSRVFQNIDPPPLSPPRECVLPPHQRRGVHSRRAVRGWGGGSIFWKTRDIGLASYSIISLHITVSVMSEPTVVTVKSELSSWFLMTELATVSVMSELTAVMAKSELTALSVMSELKEVSVMFKTNSGPVMADL